MLIKDFQTRYHYNTKTDILGRGGFAVVYKGHDTLLDRTVALKFFSKSGDDKHTLIKEISRVISLEHPNLCRYYDAALLESQNLHGETDETEVGVMEFLDGGDLKSYCKAHPEHQIKLLADVLKGISFLHKKGIIHRDLKPQNILIKITENGPVAKITDFGISKDLKSGDTGSSLLMGTIEYMAPEQFSPQKYGINGKISINLDMWSFGLIVYELVTGGNLFGSRAGDSSAEQVMGNILNDELVEAKIAHLPEPYFYLLKRCLVKDANQRIQDPTELIDKLTESTTGVFNPVRELNTGVTVNKILETTVIPQKTADNIPPNRKKSNKKVMLLGSLAGIIAIIAGIYLFIHQPAEATHPDNTAKDSTKVIAQNSEPLNPGATKDPSIKVTPPQKENKELKKDIPAAKQPVASNNDTAGREIRPVTPVVSKENREYQQTGNYFDGMAAVQDDDKWGYINQAGKEIIPLIYDDASPFSEGLAAVTKAGQTGFINKTGQVVIPLIYSDAGPFSGGLAMVKRGGKKGYLDQAGREVIPLIYEDTSPFTEGLAKVKKDGRFGFIDKNGSTIIPLIYDYAMPFSRGRALVKKDGQFNYIDKTGNVLTDIK